MSHNIETDIFSLLFYLFGSWNCLLIGQKAFIQSFNPIRTTCRLVRWYFLPYIEPIREGVRKSSLMCKFLVLHFQSFVMIG